MNYELLRICGISIGLLILFWFLGRTYIEYFVNQAKFKPSESKKKYIAPKFSEKTANETKKDLKSGNIKPISSKDIKKELSDLVKKKAQQNK